MSGMVGGIDVVFEKARREFDARALLQACLDMWPTGLFQDAEEAATYPLANALTGQMASSREFFIYKNQESADSWARDGWTERHGNDMAHFLIAGGPDRPDLVQITLVIGSVTEETERLTAAVDEALKRSHV